MQTIIVKNCHECPFSNNDNEYGKDFCNLGGLTPSNNGYFASELPKDGILDDCPLIEEDYNISINQ